MWQVASRKKKDNCCSTFNKALVCFCMMNIERHSAGTRCYLGLTGEGGHPHSEGTKAGKKSSGVWLVFCNLLLWWWRGTTTMVMTNHTAYVVLSRGGGSWEPILIKASYFWQSWLKRILGLSGPFPGSFMFWRKRNMAAVRGSGLGSVIVSGLWNMKKMKYDILKAWSYNLSLIVCSSSLNMNTGANPFPIIFNNFKLETLAGLVLSYLPNNT